MKSAAGFTLAETLLAVVILLLASSIVGAGMPAAVKAYRNAIDAANAQVLLSATVNALRSELTTARDVTVESDTNIIKYYSAQTGSRSKIYIESEEDGPDKIMLQPYDDLDDPEYSTLGISMSVPARPLVSDSMTKSTGIKGELMTVSYTGATPEPSGCVTITGLTVTRRDPELNRDVVLAKMDTALTIRPLTQAPVSTDP